MKLLALILLLATIVESPARTITGAEIIDFGTYKAVRYATAPAPRAASGTLHRTMKEQLITRTDAIKASVGTRFGIRFRLIGSPYGGPAACSIRVIRPKVRDPATGVVTTVDEFSDTTRIGYLQYAGYRFDAGWQLVPGKWTIQVVDGSKVLCEKAFEITLR